MTPSFAYIVRSKMAGRNFLYEFYFKGKKSLDIGCGEGAFVRLDPTHMHGVDTNKRVIDTLSKEGLLVKLASGDRLPYADGEFEAINSHNVIEHLPVDKAYGMIAEAARVLKTGGLFVLSSEVVTKKFWNTFGHIRPYPPKSIEKLLRTESREEFDTLSNLEIIDVFYLGDYHRNKIIYLISAFLGYFTPLCRREYFLILRKK